MDKVVARDPLLSTDALIADPSTGHAKPRTKLNNKDANTAHPIDDGLYVDAAAAAVSVVAVDVLAAVENWNRITVDRAMRPYPRAEIPSMNNNNPSVPLLLLLLRLLLLLLFPLEEMAPLFRPCRTDTDNTFRKDGANKAPTAATPPHPACNVPN